MNNFDTASELENVCAITSIFCARSGVQNGPVSSLWYFFSAAAPPANSEIKIHVYPEDQVPVMTCHAHTEGNEHEGISIEKIVFGLTYVMLDSGSSITGTIIN